MFKSIHPITRIFWIALVVGVVIYQLNRTEYPGSDTVIINVDVESPQSFSSDYEDMNPCVLPVVFFEGQSSQLDIQAMQDLSEVAEKMIQNPGMRLEVSGKQGRNESRGLAHYREKAIIKHLVQNYNISLNRLVPLEGDAETFESPSGHERHGHGLHSSRHQRGHGHQGKKSCKSSSSHSYSYSYNYNCSRKTYKHCNTSRYSCNKSKIKKENRAVYLTCMN